MFVLCLVNYDSIALAQFLFLTVTEVIKDKSCNRNIFSKVSVSSLFPA